jgi:16S rRNA (adenine1518-N6/adenine1519-N6)-dimethyltransferase
VGARLGQHFLFDPAILARIAAAAAPQRAGTVLEIGPGKGTLTAHLARRAERVVAVEADARLAAALGEAPPAPNVAVVHGDALAVAWPPAEVVCGNIPYRITSPLIERALTPPRPRRIVFLVQREVADRLAASPGSRAYGALTAGVRLVAEVERLFSVRAGAFRPPPRVESAVVRLTPRTHALVRDADEERRVRALIRALFQRRRQQLQRALREATAARAEVVAAALEAAGLAPTARAEDLGPAAFVTLARALGTHLAL